MVNRLLKIGVRIQVVAIFHANALQIADDVVAFKVGGAVKGHVFKQVSQALLVVVFLQATCFYHQPQFGMAGRRLVLPDKIHQTIGQFSDADVGIGAQGIIGFKLCMAGNAKANGYT